MVSNQRLMLGAGLVMYANAALHLLAVPLAGFAQDAWIMAPVAIVYAAIGWGLIRGWGWISYPTFFIALIGAIIAWAAMGVSSIPAWVLALILLADLCVAIQLGLRIWRGPKAA